MKWLTAPLEQLAQVDRAGIAPENIRSGTIYVGLENITNSGKFVEVSPVTNGELASTKFAFTGEHILHGKLRPYLRKVARPDFSGICSTDILPILPGPKVNRDYLAHFLRLDSSISFAVSRSVGVNLPRISPGILGTLMVPLPPMKEQRRIAAILDQAEELRAKRRRALAKLDTLTQSLFLEMFGDPRVNPKRWNMGCIAELGEVAGGLQLTPKRQQYEMEAPYLRVANVHRDRVDVSEIKTMGLLQTELLRITLRSGDLLIVEGHGNAKEIGRCAVWDSQVADCVHQNHLIRVRFDPRYIDSHFASTYLNSNSGREQVLRSGIWSN